MFENNFTEAKIKNSNNNNKNVIKKLRAEKIAQDSKELSSLSSVNDDYSKINYCYYSATTKNTEALVERLGGVGVEINSKNCRHLTIDKPSILIFPTYAIKGKILPPPVGHFLSNPTNRLHIKGVIGTGDTLFNEHFCFGAVKASEKLGVPLIHKVELKGTATDVKIIQNFIIENNLL